MARPSTGTDRIGWGCRNDLQGRSLNPFHFVSELVFRIELTWWWRCCGWVKLETLRAKPQAHGRLVPGQGHGGWNPIAGHRVE